MSVPPFFRLIGFTVEPVANDITQRKGKREASVVVLPPDAAPWNRKFTDVIRIGLLLPVYTFKPLLYFQAQHLFPLPISNHRLRAA
jgi:hypothetical protein